MSLSLIHICIQIGQLVKDLQTNGALTCDDLFVIVGVDEGHAGLGLQGRKGLGLFRMPGTAKGGQTLDRRQLIAAQKTFGLYGQRGVGGCLLYTSLEAVITGQTPNEKDALLAAAARFSAS